MIITHHANLLWLLEHFIDFVNAAIQYDVRFGWIFDLLQQRPVKMCNSFQYISLMKSIRRMYFTCNQRCRAIDARWLETRMDRELSATPANVPVPRLSHKWLWMISIPMLSQCLHKPVGQNCMQQQQQCNSINTLVHSSSSLYQKQLHHSTSSSSASLSLMSDDTHECRTHGRTNLI